MGTKKMSDPACGTVTDAKENELRWVPEHQAALMKVCVFGNDGVSVLLRERPNEGVVGLHETVRFDVR
jgi:hypothetical protein